MADDRESDEHGETKALREGLKTASEAAEGVAKGAEQAARMIEGGGSGEVKPAAVMRGTAGALGAAEGIARAVGADPLVRDVLGVAQRAGTLAAAAYEAGEKLVEAGGKILDVLTGEAEQRRVRYELEWTAGNETEWRVREVEIEEALNQPYRVRLVISTEDLDALPIDLLGQDCRLRIRRGDTSRSIHGLVSRVDHGKRTERHLTAVIEVVPALDVLRHIRDSRVFQGRTVLEIIDASLSAYLAEYDRELRIDATGTYLPREYCVQYQESPLDFFHRLCEEEGLTYFFEQSGEHETLVIVDDNASFHPAYLLPTAADVPFVAHRGGDLARAEPVYALGATDRLGPTSLTLADFDWTAGRLPFSSEQRSRDARDRDREQYEHGGLNITSYDPDARRYTERDDRLRVQRGRERQALTTFELRGRGAVTGFTAGTVFTLSGHPDPALDGEYLLVSVRHRGRDRHGGEADAGSLHDELDAHERARTSAGSSTGAGAGASEGSSTGSRTERAEPPPEYENWFVCIPSAVPHRPQRVTPKPRIAGVQTALVVGPAGEEVWTDEHGRIRVQFHWDRLGTNDERSTCWVRVMQSWAGAGFGTMFVPRIGMEVVVSFLDGDPDRPLVTGCVYNATNPPPISLPDDKTQSVLRTRSSPESEGFNELRFEDRAGGERIYLHAQRDLDEEVERDRSIRIDRNQSIRVGADHRETIGQDQHIHVERDRYKTVDGDEDVHIVGNRHTTIDVDSTDEIGGNYVGTIAGTTHLTVTGRATEQFDGGREATVHRFDNLVVEGANKNTRVQGQYNITAEEHFKAHCGTSQLYLKDKAYLASDGKVQLVSNGDVIELRAATELKLVCGAASVTLKSNGEIALSGPSKVSLASSGSNTVETAPTGVSISGARIEASATGTHTISGALVRIN